MYGFPSLCMGSVLPQLQPANQVKTHVISNVYFRLSQRPDDDGKCWKKYNILSHNWLHNNSALSAKYMWITSLHPWRSSLLPAPLAL